MRANLILKCQRPLFYAIGGRNMADDDFALTAGWGHCGPDEAVMPGQGHTVERSFTPGERTAMDNALPALGETTIDIYLNSEACRCNIPASVWTYRLGSYQVLKKWLSYREHDVLGRTLKPEEVQHFAATARRIAKIMMLTAGTAQ